MATRISAAYESEIVKLVEANPGIALHAMAKRLHRGTRALSQAVQLCIKKGSISARGHTTARRYFPALPAEKGEEKPTNGGGKPIPTPPNPPATVTREELAEAFDEVRNALHAWGRLLVQQALAEAQANRAREGDASREGRGGTPPAAGGGGDGQDAGRTARRDAVGARGSGGGEMSDQSRMRED